MDAQSKPCIRATSVILYLYDRHYLKFIACIGIASDNKAKVYATLMVLKIASYIACHNLQVFAAVPLDLGWEPMFHVVINLYPTPKVLFCEKNKKLVKDFILHDVI